MLELSLSYLLLFASISSIRYAPTLWEGRRLLIPPTYRIWFRGCFSAETSDVRVESHLWGYSLVIWLILFTIFHINCHSKYFPNSVLQRHKTWKIRQCCFNQIHWASCFWRRQLYLTHRTDKITHIYHRFGSVLLYFTPVSCSGECWVSLGSSPNAFSGNTKQPIAISFSFKHENWPIRAEFELNLLLSNRTIVLFCLWQGFVHFCCHVLP